MIRGNSERKIKMYLFIDRLNEGLGWTKPIEGEEFWGIPSENSYPFIEHRKRGVVTQSVNTADISSIEFDYTP